MVLKNSQQSPTLKVASGERVGISGAGEWQVGEQKARDCGEREDRREAYARSKSALLMVIIYYD